MQQPTTWRSTLLIRRGLGPAGLLAALLAAGGILGPAWAADSPDASPLMPSEASELQMVYDSLRRAANAGDARTYRGLYDPATLGESARRRDGSRTRLTGDWLRKHAAEWPDLDGWDVADVSGVGKWARLTYRHKHLKSGRPDGRWDFYFILYKKVDGHWRLNRRAIATFPGNGTKAPPHIADLPVVPAFQLPPRFRAASAVAGAE